MDSRKVFIEKKMASVQTLKSVNLVRVDQGKSQHLYASRQNLGEVDMCPASAHHIQHDIYGRPASQNTIGLSEKNTQGLDASCGINSQFSTIRHIQRENMERPYIPICSAGLRGAADLMGVGRDIIPQDLYGTGHRGNMIRHYNTKNNAPWDTPQALELSYPNHHSRLEQPYDFSHDASKSAYYKG